MLSRFKGFLENRKAIALKKLIGDPSFLAHAVANIDLGTLAFLESRRDASVYINERMHKAKAIWDKKGIMEEAVRNISVKGFIAEFGVYQGETLKHICELCPDRMIYGFDSFEGLPEIWRDGFPASTFKTDEPRLIGHEQHVKLIKGWFKDTVGIFAAGLKEDARAALLHVDCDLYSSTCDALEPIINRIVPGTIILFDEYFAYPGWRNGEWAAWRDICGRHGIKYHYLAYNRTHEQVCVVVESTGGST